MFLKKMQEKWPEQCTREIGPTINFKPGVHKKTWRKFEQIVILNAQDFLGEASLYKERNPEQAKIELKGLGKLQGEPGQIGKL